MASRSEKDFVTVLHRNGFEDLNDLWEKRVGDLGDDKAKNPAASGDQSPRLRIRIVA